MKELSQILAKSKEYGGIGLLEHTEHVVSAIEIFTEKFKIGFDISMARKAAVLHDLGKAHPHFQRKIHGVKATTFNEERKWDFIHRHELSSLGYLPIFPVSEWNILIDMVVAHHKSIENDKRQRGILDLENEIDRFWQSNHLMDWEEWSPYGLEILEYFGYPTRPISKIEAKKSLDYVLEYCKNLEWGWSPLRGLLMSADHFGSAFVEKTKSKLLDLFVIPNLAFYHDASRKNDLYPLSTINTEDTRPHTIVVAPTGAGKTDFLLKRCKGRIFYTLPFQASINAMYERIKNDIKNENSNIESIVRVLHSTSALLLKSNKEAQLLQNFGGAAIKVLTPHQLASVIFGTSGYESLKLDLQGTDVILDEIHTYSDYSRAMVLEIVRTLLDLDCRIHIGTATMPSVLYNKVLELLRDNCEVYEVKLDAKTIESFDRHIIHKIHDEKEIDDILWQAFEQKEKVLLIFNTVAKAQREFRRLRSRYSTVPSMLIHSRFRRGDRVILEEKLKREFNGDGSMEYGDGLKPCLVIATQVVEVSLDISFDRMITEAAPLDALIQRFGRINRKRRKDTIGIFKPVHVFEPGTKTLPYKSIIVKDSFEQLPDCELLRERDLQDMIDNVFPTLDTKEIDVHLICVNGQYRIKELCNRPNSAIIDALEIESATCILECDRERYELARWDERISLEIPVNFRVIRNYKNQYIQLEVGAYPFVVPQKEVEHQLYGLELVEPENIL